MPHHPAESTAQLYASIARSGGFEEHKSGSVGAFEGDEEGADERVPEEVGLQLAAGFFPTLTFTAALCPLAEQEAVVAVAWKRRGVSKGPQLATATLTRKYTLFLGARARDVQTKASSLVVGVFLGQYFLGAVYVTLEGKSTWSGEKNRKEERPRGAPVGGLPTGSCCRGRSSPSW